MQRFGRARSLALDISPLRDSVPFRALCIGQIVSQIGTQMRVVAIPFQVFDLTGSTVAVGLIGLAEVVPLVAFSLVGGALADTYDRRKLMLFSQLLLLIDSLALAAVSLSDTPSLVAIYALTAVGSSLDAIDKPARRAMEPSLVRPEQLPAAVALRQVVYQTTQIAGPAVGGALIAVLGGRVEAVYVADAATFVASLVALHWLPRRVPLGEGSAGGVGLTAVREGLRFVLHTPIIFSIFLIDLVAMIFGMPRAVFPELASETFGLSAAGLGLLYAAPSVGALIGALTTGWVGGVKRHGRAVLLAVMVWGLAITGAGLSLFSLWLTLAFLALAGAADVVSAVFRGTILLQATPDHLLGRSTALNLMVVAGGPRIGDVEAGLMAGLVGAGPSVLVGGVACLAGTAVVGAAFPQLRTYVRPASPSAEEPSPVR
ncbi:MAG: MFS transporter [Actinomycetota bacterium]